MGHASQKWIQQVRPVDVDTVAVGDKMLNCRQWGTTEFCSSCFLSRFLGSAFSPTSLSHRRLTLGPATALSTVEV